MDLDGITINGVMLKEHIKDKRLISEDIESKRVVLEANDKIYLNRRIKPKYAEKREKNGKVKILNQHEKNRMSADELAAKALRDFDYYRAVVIVLVASAGTGKWWDINSLSKELVSIANEHDVPQSKGQMNYKLRFPTGKLNHTQIKDYIDIREPKSDGNSLNRKIFMVKDKHKDIPMEEFLKISEQVLPSYRSPGTPRGQRRPKPKEDINVLSALAAKEKITPQEPPPELPPQEPEQNEMIKALTDTIKSSKSIPSPSKLFEFNGDIHLHFHFGNKKDT